MVAPPGGTPGGQQAHAPTLPLNYTPPAPPCLTGSGLSWSSPREEAGGCRLWNGQMQLSAVNSSWCQPACGLSTPPLQAVLDVMLDVHPSLAVGRWSLAGGCCCVSPVYAQWRVQAALFVLSVAIYGRAFHADFVWDDRAAVLGNTDLRPESPWSTLLEHDFWGQNITQEYVGPPPPPVSGVVPVTAAPAQWHVCAPWGREAARG
jgi:hypothetical protein